MGAERQETREGREERGNGRGKTERKGGTRKTGIIILR